MREREVYDTLQTLSPFGKVTVELELGILEGEEELDRFERSFAASNLGEET